MHPERRGHKRYAAAPALILLAAWVAAGPDGSVTAAGGGEDAATLFAQAEELGERFELQAARAAIEKYLSAVEIWEELGEHGSAARAHRRIGALRARLGEGAEALERYERALALAREAGEMELESELLSEVGRARALLGDSESALTECRAARERALEVESVSAEARALNCHAEVEYHRGRLTEALSLHRSAEALWRQVGDTVGLAETLLLAGTISSDLSRFDEAEERLADSADLFAATGDRKGLALTLLARGRLSDRLGEYQAALNSFQAARELFETMGDRLWQASASAGTASVYEQMGNNDQALADWNRALELYSQVGVRLAELDTLITIGAMHLERGDHEGALGRFERALALSRELGNPRLEATAHRYVGLVHQTRGEAGAALESYRRALAMLKTDEDPRFEAYLLADLGSLHLEAGDAERALEQYGRAVERSRAGGDRLGEAVGLYHLARLGGARGELAEARLSIEDSLGIVESLRAGVASRELRVSYLASIHDYYQLHIELLMRLAASRGDDRLAAEALQASERSRARSLLESLAEAGVDVRAGAEPGLLAAERRLRLALESRTEQLMRLLSEEPDAPEVAALERELKELALEFDRLQAELRSKSPRYAALTQPQPLTLAEIQQRVLDPHTLLLEYSLGEERSYLWAVSNREHTSFELAPRAEIERAAREVYELLTARLGRPGESLAEHRTRVREADRRYWPAAARLSALLLEPVATLMRGKRLLIVADGALQYVPFGALVPPGSVGEPVPLALGHEIVYLPSASTLDTLRRQTADRRVAQRSVAVLADPVFEADDPRLLAAPPPETDRPSPSGAGALRQVDFLTDGKLQVPRLLATRREARAIVAIAPEGSSLEAVDFEASRQMAMSAELARHRIVHFATHGLVSSENPSLSGVLFSMVDRRGQPQNGLLGLHDIYNLELPVELVVLSACNTALGRDVRGEGLMGLVRGFMYAGARRVVASLWKVDDEATLELMRRFYLQMLEGGLSPPAALRQAQVEMWHSESWRAPFFWGGFILQGEWK